MFIVLMSKKSKLIVIFDEQPVRRVWNEAEERWYLSVVDVVLFVFPMIKMNGVPGYFFRRYVEKSFYRWDFWLYQ